MGNTNNFCRLIVRFRDDFEVMLAAELATMFQVSNMHVVSELPQSWDGWYVHIGEGKEWEIMAVKPEKHKCPRCWSFTAEKEDELCGRCWEVIEEAQNPDLTL